MTIRAEHISFSYLPGDDVLKDFSLSCPASSITVMLGANGAGKSTLLKLLGGILVPSSGSIWLDDRQLTDLTDNERARHIGMLLQNQPPPFDVTVRDFVMFGRTPRLPRFHKPTAADWQAVDQAIEHLKLSPLSEKSVRKISGGEYQRARLAALLALESEVMLLDEPTTAQDPKASSLIADEMSELRQNGRTIVVITHDLTWAENIADTIVMLKNGRLLDEGRPQDVLTKEKIMRVY